MVSEANTLPDLHASGVFPRTASSPTELVFVVEQTPEGTYTAVDLRASCFAEADTIEELKSRILAVVRGRNWATEPRPKLVRLHYFRDELLCV
jgi:hypothetical protein